MPYEVTTNKSRLDIDLIHQFLSRDSYWAKNIPREVLERSIANSLCFAVFDDNRQIAFGAFRALRRWHLVTSDAHGLYRQYGFDALKHPERHMETFPSPPERGRRCRGATDEGV